MPLVGDPSSTSSRNLLLDLVPVVEAVEALVVVEPLADVVQALVVLAAEVLVEAPVALEVEASPKAS